MIYIESTEDWLSKIYETELLYPLKAENTIAWKQYKYLKGCLDQAYDDYPLQYSYNEIDRMWCFFNKLKDNNIAQDGTEVISKTMLCELSETIRLNM